MTAFVILHYRAIDTTRSCVKSIRALAGDKHIVIVDNASPNGTGAVLAEEFAASPDVTVLLHGKNDGFARGNNVGTRWVYEHLDADFTVVLNNASRSRSTTSFPRSRAFTRSTRSTCSGRTLCRCSPAFTRARKRCTAARSRACGTSVRALRAAKIPSSCC